MSSIEIKVTCPVCKTERLVDSDELFEESWLDCPTCNEQDEDTDG